MNTELLFEISLYLISSMRYDERDILKLQNDIIDLVF